MITLRIRRKSEIIPKLESSQNLETLEKDFGEFWKKINATGNFENAIKELNSKHNASSKKSLNYPKRLKSIAVREWRYLKMLLKS